MFSIKRAGPFTYTAIVTLVGLTACGGGEEASGGSGPGSRRGNGADRITPVEIVTVEQARMSNTSLVTGQLEPLRTVGVNAQLGGALLNVSVEEGDVVRSGQVIAEIDVRELEAQGRAADANLAFAKSTATRSEELFEARIVTAVEFERDRAALAAAEASVAQLKTRLGFARITSPINGVVTERFAQTGDIVAPQTRIFSVADMSTLVTRLAVSELEVAQLREGTEIPLRVDALEGASYPGRIRRIFPGADPETRLVPVEVAISGANAARLRPGYTVRATLQLDTRENALVIPTRAVLGAAGSRSVFIVRGDGAERRTVRVGPDVDGIVEVFDGLVKGDTVVVAGNALLRDGGKVRVVQPLTPDAATAATTARTGE